MVKMSLEHLGGGYIKTASCSPFSVVERNICNSCPCETQQCIRKLCGAHRRLCSQVYRLQSSWRSMGAGTRLKNVAPVLQISTRPVGIEGIIQLEFCSACGAVPIWCSQKMNYYNSCTHQNSHMLTS